jgi:hypothetical protein
VDTKIRAPVEGSRHEAPFSTVPRGVADKISPDPPDRDTARTTRPASRAAPAGARRAPKLGVPRRRGREARMAPDPPRRIAGLFPDPNYTSPNSKSAGA